MIREVLLQAARRCAEGVAADVKRRRFWPPAKQVRYDEFEALFPAEPEQCVDAQAFARALRGRGRAPRTKGN